MIAEWLPCSYLDSSPTAREVVEVNEEDYVAMQLSM